LDFDFSMAVDGLNRAAQNAPRVAGWKESERTNRASEDHSTLLNIEPENGREQASRK
jgi:hypothetical protein